MEKLLGFLGVLVTMMVACLLQGWLIWLIWPAIIPVIFPGLVTSGVIIGKITLWQSIILIWLCHTLFGSGININEDKD